MFRQTISREHHNSRISRTRPSCSRRSLFSAFALLFALAAPLAGAQTISINFQGGQGGPITPMDPTEVAGVVRVANWNNAPDPTGTLSALIDSTGATVPGGTVTYSGSPNTWANGLADAPGDNRLLKGYLDTNNTSVTTVAVTGLDAAATYSVYVYGTRRQRRTRRTVYYRKPDVLFDRTGRRGLQRHLYAVLLYNRYRCHDRQLRGFHRRRAEQLYP